MKNTNSSKTTWVLTRKIIIRQSAGSNISLTSNSLYLSKRIAVETCAAERERIAAAMKDVYSKTPGPNDIMVIGDIIVDARDIIAAELNVVRALFTNPDEEIFVDGDKDDNSPDKGDATADETE